MKYAIFSTVAVLLLLFMLLKSEKVTLDASLPIDKESQVEQTQQSEENVSKGDNIIQNQLSFNESTVQEQNQYIPPTLGGLIDAYDKRTNAFEKQELIKIARAEGHLIANDWQEELDLFCQPEDLNPDIYTEDLLWIYRLRKEFCDDFIPEIFIGAGMNEERLERVADLYARGPAYDAALDIFAETEFKNFDDIIELTDSFTNRLDVDAAISLIRDLQFEENVVVGGFSDIPNISSVANVASTHQIALKLYQCRTFGCQPNSTEILSACMDYKFCSPGWNYIDLLNETVSAAELKAANQILDAIITNE